VKKPADIVPIFVMIMEDNFAYISSEIIRYILTKLGRAVAVGRSENIRCYARPTLKRPYRMRQKTNFFIVRYNHTSFWPLPIHHFQETWQNM